ncbi:UNVERIFIED_CONTAM: hypothetical protein Sangu_2429700 [Sesamum angustifolium]|uniref:Uncharacterized protein n=1 Tax=Sesamum angustifolium TaxID=2727405 RepID=A0AAW2KZJ6_9LAMI
MFLKLLEEHRRQENNNKELASSSQASVAPNEQQLWMSTAGSRKRRRVFSLDSEAHLTIAGPSQPSNSTAPTLSPPHPESDDLRDRVQMIERYIRSRDPDWPDRIVTQPPAAPRTLRQRRTCVCCKKKLN